jgi:hypothetical protein
LWEESDGMKIQLSCFSSAGERAVQEISTRVLPRVDSNSSPANISSEIYFAIKRNFTNTKSKYLFWSYPEMESKKCT